MDFDITDEEKAYIAFSNSTRVRTKRELNARNKSAAIMCMICDSSISDAEKLYRIFCIADEIFTDIAGKPLFNSSERQIWNE